MPIEFKQEQQIFILYLVGGSRWSSKMAVWLAKNAFTGFDAIVCVIFFIQRWTNPMPIPHIVALLFDLIKDYSVDQTLTALSHILLCLTPQIVDFYSPELTNQLQKMLCHPLIAYVTSICYAVKEIAGNFLAVNQHENEHSIGAYILSVTI